MKLGGFNKCLILLVLISLLLITGCKKVNSPVESQQPEKVQLPNPASAYCLEQGGRSEIRTAEDGSQSGFCIFEDGTECAEWQFFRGECFR